MKHAMQQLDPRSPNITAGGGRFARWHHAGRHGLLTLVLCFLTTSWAADPYSTILDKRFEGKPTSSPVQDDQATDPKATDPNLADLEVALKTEAQQMARGPEIAATPPSLSPNDWTIGIVLLIAAAAGLGKFIHVLHRRVNSSTAPEERWQSLVELDPSIEGFFIELRDGLTASATHNVDEHGSLNVVYSATNPGGNGADGTLKEFFNSSPRRLAGFRTLIAEIARATDDATRQKVLLEFSDQISLLKESSRIPALHPVWLIASALEGFLKQLSRDPSNFTPSAQRTIAGAIDLLEALCVPGVDPGLVTEPAVRLLAVDDDPISRHAISFALKKAFNAPDLAPDGEAALALATRQTYDAIFLDVEMPGMDGFELCTKIREEGHNRTTPVVFVTRHSDFGSRTKSSLSGGQDLIAKPFLAFEITVKALTLAMRSRLKNGKVRKPAITKEASSATTTVKTNIKFVPPAAIPTPSLAESLQEEKEQGRQNDSQSVPSTQPEISQLPPQWPNHSATTGNATGETCDPNVFFTAASTTLERLRSQLEAARQAADPGDFRRFLGAVYVGTYMLSLEAERAELRGVFRLGHALEGMLSKLMEHPKLCTPSTLDTADAALGLLNDLCLANANPDLGDTIRLLVVDDDPIALRAISGAVQLVFGRPDSANSGEAALALAAEKPFDLIFMDVMMPGIDGFTACKSIHETDLNSRTPVVFVTSNNDVESRSKATDSGGCGFIPKPVLPSQITLTALTFILKARLNRLRPAPILEEAGLAIA